MNRADLSTAFWALWYGPHLSDMDVAIGIDTSCYTTSTAALDRDGRLVSEVRIPLVVKPGGRGLSQSEMVFQHVRNLPLVMEEMRRVMGPGRRIVAVGTSCRPRPVEGSYMPVFLAGCGTARTLGAAMNCPVIEISHQENHVLAGLWSAGVEIETDFLAVHASGGTTEILRARLAVDGFEIELLGGTVDLHAGQFLDRVGVSMGLPFPAGPHLERLATLCDGIPPKTPVSVDGCNISFSGPETHVKRWLASEPEPAAVASSVQYCIAESLQRALTAAVDSSGLRTVLLVGGVAANEFIRVHVAEALQRSQKVSVFWPAPEFSGDNAVGAAWWALKHKVV